MVVRHAAAAAGRAQPARGVADRDAGDGGGERELYVIDPVGLRPMSGYAHGGDSGFASETGGYAFVNTNDIQGAAARIFDEAGSSYYVLRMIDPPVQRTADLREVKVQVLRKDVTVRAEGTRECPGKTSGGERRLRAVRRRFGERGQPFAQLESLEDRLRIFFLEPQSGHARSATRRQDARRGAARRTWRPRRTHAQLAGPAGSRA